MSGTPQQQPPRRVTNVGSLLLTPQENESLFGFLGKKCVVSPDRGATGLGHPQAPHRGAAGRGPGRAGACEDSPAGRWEVEAVEVSSHSTAPSRRRERGGPRRPRCPPGSPRRRAGSDERRRPLGPVWRSCCRPWPRSLGSRAAPRPPRAAVWAPSFRASLSVGTRSSRGPAGLPLPASRPVLCRGTSGQGKFHCSMGPGRTLRCTSGTTKQCWTKL